MTTKIRVGVAGVGMAGDFHVECLRHIHGIQVELAGVTSLRPERRKAFGEARGIPVYDSVEEMLPHIDLLDICSPPYAHAGAILAAAKAGKHVVVEKPLTGFFGPAGDDADRRSRPQRSKRCHGKVQGRHVLALPAP